MKKVLFVISVAAGTVWLAGCDVNELAGKTPAEDSAKAEARTGGGASSVPRTPLPADKLKGAGVHGGEVLTKQNSGGYSYYEVGTPEGVIWVAGPQTELKPGTQIYWSDYAVMRGFHSNSLNKSFDQILFVSAVSTQPVRMAEPATGGVIKSSKISGGYSYLEVEQGGRIVWVAAPAGNYQPGQKVTWQNPAPMQNFHSASLDKTFDLILFVGGVNVER